MKNNEISRRTFVNRAVAGSAVIALGPLKNLVSDNKQKESTWPADATKFRFRMIGYGHIDPVWLWPWTEGVAVVHSTFRAALDRMNETSDFTFVSSSAQFYQWVADNDPSMLTEIRKRIKEGRWSIVGGWWVEPDVNIPGGEAMVRQGLYGQMTLQRLFGCRASVACNPDSFGHTSSLPQIIKQQGMDNYIFMRPGSHEKTLPADLFWWEGDDGTSVLAYRIQITYGATGPLHNHIEKILTMDQNQPIKNLMVFFGAGDHGGGPTKESILSVQEMKTEKDAPKVLFSTPENYFKEIRDKKNLNIPVVKDELQYHAVGCYTTEAEIKKNNRLSEAALIIAEKIAAIGSSCWGSKYPKAEFTSAWQRVLFLQFHDSMAGTSLYEHSQTAREGYGFALDIAHQATYMAVQKLEWQVPAEDPGSQYLMVFNPHAWEVTGSIEYDFNHDTGISSRVEDESGSALLHQWTYGSTETGNRKKLIVNTKLPPFGYRQIRVLPGDSQHVKGYAKAEDTILENEFLKISFSTKGTISILDKETGNELFTGGKTGCRAIIIDDPSDTWSHDIKTFSDEIGAFGNAVINITENGSLRATMRVITTYHDSTLSIDWSLCSGSRNLEALVTLDWHEHLKMLKFSFPVDVESPVSTYETPYGHIERATNGHENPGQRWIDLTGNCKGGTHGLTVFNDAKYGYNVAGNDMRISVARSAVYAHHNPKVLDMKAEHLWMDQGIQTFRMLLVPHRETWKKSNTVRTAEEFISPSVLIYQGIHGGKKPKTGSFLSVDAPNVIVSSVKISETGDDLIIRCVESVGLAAEVTIDLRFAGRKWTGNFKPCEIKTLRLNQKTGNIKEVNLLEE
jgi:alpha-mannosidase